MQQQTTEKENATSTTQNIANETHKQDSNLVENIPLENGFVIRRRDKQWFTTLGDTKITELTENYSAQLEQIDELNWKVLINVMIHVFRTMKIKDDIDKMADKPYTLDSL